MRKKGDLKSKFFGSFLVLFALVVLSLSTVFYFSRTYYQDYQIAQEIARLQEDANKLKSKKLELIEKLEYVKSPSFVEEKARTELNMSKTGEKVIMMNSGLSFDSDDRQNKSNVLTSIDTPNYIKWWYYFLGQNKKSNL